MKMSYVRSSIGSTVELIDDNENDNEKKGNDNENKGNDKDEEKEGWKDMETLQVWKIYPTYLRNTATVEVYVWFDCEAKWGNVS